MPYVRFTLFSIRYECRLPIYATDGSGSDAEIQASELSGSFQQYCVEKLAFSLRQTKATKIDLRNRSIFNDH